MQVRIPVALGLCLALACALAPECRAQPQPEDLAARWTAERSTCVRIRDAVDAAIEEIRSRNRAREPAGLAEARAGNQERLERCLAAADLVFSASSPRPTRGMIMQSLPPPPTPPSVPPQPSPRTTAPGR